MDLVVIVAVNLLPQNAAYTSQLIEFLQGAGSNDAVLKPEVGSFDPGFGLRREGVDDFHTWNAHYLATKGQQHRFEGSICTTLYPFLARSETRVGSQRSSTEAYPRAARGLCGLDMSPSRLLWEEISE